MKKHSDRTIDDKKSLTYSAYIREFFFFFLITTSDQLPSSVTYSKNSYCAFWIYTHAVPRALHKCHNEFSQEFENYCYYLQFTNAN